MSRIGYGVMAAVAVLTCCAVLTGCSGDSDGEPGRYSSSTYGFSIVFPQGWEIVEGDGEEVAMVEATSPWEDDDDEFSEHITVDVEDITKGTTVEVYFEETMEAQASMIPGFKTKARGRTTIDGRDAIWVEFDMEEEGGSLTVLGYAMVKGNRGYLITCIAQDRKYVSYEDVFRQAVQTFRCE
jgi:hypothetical protein